MTTPNVPSLFVPKHLLGHQSPSKLGPFLLPAKREHGYTSEREKKQRPSAGLLSGCAARASHWQLRLLRSPGLRA
uniref:Uncharacterized protein n=1 Tax=Rangifer tarandus platyrhynchus TaxID=3082113 RepID=A0ACB0FDE0_RANTA|nr:unnamed protein product [Rangifer tarandus platyrhynchus]